MTGERALDTVPYRPTTHVIVLCSVGGMMCDGVSTHTRAQKRNITPSKSPQQLWGLGHAHVAPYALGTAALGAAGASAQRPSVWQRPRVHGPWHGSPLGPPSAWRRLRGGLGTAASVRRPRYGGPRHGSLGAATLDTAASARRPSTRRPSSQGGPARAGGSETET